jgi:hypothetical protein
LEITLEETAKKRCEEICNELTKEPWYSETVDQIIAMQREICGRGGGIKPLLNEYDELCLKLQCRIEEQIYLQALKDAEFAR